MARRTLHDWTSKSKGKVPSLEGDLRALTFNVIAATAFPEPSVGKIAGESSDDEVTTESYQETLHIVLENAILLMLIPYRFLTGALLPRGIARVGHAAAAYKSILTKVVVDEATVLNRKTSRPGGLITPLVRALSQESGDEDSNKAKRSGLSADEILGNIFTIHFAGHDTVLITLTFALTLLATHSDVQEWLHEEIVQITRGDKVSKMTYHDKFSKLSRCHAVLLETLRLYAPITGVPKIASEKAPNIRVGEHRILAIPPGIEIFPLLLGVQTDPRFWENPFEWNPSRWIKVQPGMEEEQLVVPRKGTFFPWSDGPQICVGKKFSQVEGVAVLACLFRSHYLRLERQPGENESQTRRRAYRCTEDVNYNLLLRMNHPERVRLECVPRDGP